MDRRYNPLPLRREGGWQTFDRWIRSHRLVATIQRKLAGMMQWQVSRLVSAREGVEWTVQTAGGGASGGAGEDYIDINVDVACIEQQGFASGVGVGARGLVCSYVGGVTGSAAGFGLRKKNHRPTIMQDWEVCIYQQSGTRVWAKDDGQLLLEAGLADYRDDPADLDEGSKLRLNKAAVQGDAELYGEHEVQVRAEPKTGDPPAIVLTLSAEAQTAVIKAETDGNTYARITIGADGAITLQSTVGGQSSSITMSTAGHITATPRAGSELRLGGDVGLLAGARSTDPINPGFEMAAWATAVETVINGIVPGSFTPLNNFALTVAVPLDSGNFGSIGSASSVVKLK